MEKIIRRKKVRELLGGVSNSTFHNWTNPASKYFKPDFPRKVKVGSVVGYLESEIDNFIRSIADAR